MSLKPPTQQGDFALAIVDAVVNRAEGTIRKRPLDPETLQGDGSALKRTLVKPVTLMEFSCGTGDYRGNSCEVAVIDDFEDGSNVRFPGEEGIQPLDEDVKHGNVQFIEASNLREPPPFLALTQPGTREGTPVFWKGEHACERRYGTFWGFHQNWPIVHDLSDDVIRVLQDKQLYTCSPSDIDFVVRDK